MAFARFVDRDSWAIIRSYMGVLDGHRLCQRLGQCFCPKWLPSVILNLAQATWKDVPDSGIGIPLEMVISRGSFVVAYHDRSNPNERFLHECTVLVRPLADSVQIWKWLQYHWSNVDRLYIAMYVANGYRFMNIIAGASNGWQLPDATDADARLLNKAEWYNTYKDNVATNIRVRCTGIDPIDGRMKLTLLSYKLLAPVVVP
jgi:hypothetical protein